jgi:hypothetical protein
MPLSPGVRRLLRASLRVLLVAWAATWSWFVLAVSLGEPPPPPWWIPAAWLGSLALLVFLCWRLPRLGGALLAAAGVGAALYFRNPGAQALLAAPAVALGLATLAVGGSGRPASARPAA